MSEFRRAKRRKAEDGVPVLDTMAERVIGHLGDLSESGMLLIMSQPLVSDALYQLRFSLPGADGRSRIVDVGAHELWSDPAAAPGQVWTGFRFIDITSSDLLFVRAWVNAADSENA